MERRWTELGAFLRSRRARSEARFDLPGDRRRVPGQRREEVAAAAGVSVAYYTRLEQGRAPRVSDDVLSAVARGLALDDAERAHVWRLAHPSPSVATAGSAEVLRPDVVALLDAVSPTPALVLGRDRHLLAWNATGHALHAPHIARSVVDDPGRRPWWPELFFSDARVVARFIDWPVKARDTVADLRIELSGRPDDDPLRALVAGLCVRSGVFDRLWSEIPVDPCAYHDRGYRDAELGEFELHDEFLELGDDAGQRLALFTAAPGTPGAHALDRLADAVRSRPPDPALSGS